jgi:FkbM family methyltransferase
VDSKDARRADGLLPDSVSVPDRGRLHTSLRGLLQPVVIRAKDITQGTPLEHVARRSWKRIDERFFSDPVNYRYSRQTVAVMRKALSRKSNCVDVGASVGDVLHYIKKICPYGTHYAFEPIPTSYEKLAANFPNVNVLDLALTDTSGETTFYVARDLGYSSLRRAAVTGLSEIAEEITAKTARLDDVLPRDLPIDFMKVDVEGAELQVFKGAVDTIRRYQPLIVFEHQRDSERYDAAIPQEVYDLLTIEHGLHISLMESWLADGRPLDREEFIESYRNRTDFMYLAHK